MIIINPLILNRMGRFLLIIIIGHDCNHYAPLRQSRSTHKYYRSPFKSTLDVISHLTKIKCNPTSVTSAGMLAVFLPKEDSADTDAAERPLMARNDGRAEATCYAG